MMNWLDIVIVCLALIGLTKGLFDGFIRQVVSLLALIIGVVFCGKAAALLRGYFIEWDWFSPETISIMSYIVGFLLIVGVITLAGNIVHRVIGATPLSLLNHIAGGIFGFITMVLFTSLFFNLMELVDAGSVIIARETKFDSRFYQPVLEIFQTIFPKNLFTLGT